MRIKGYLLLVLLGAILAGVPLLIYIFRKDAPEVSISTKTELVTNYITNLRYITNAPKGCEEIAAKYNALIDERRIYLDTPSLIYASNDYVYVSNAWRVERAAMSVRNKPTIKIGAGVAYPLGIAATVQYTPIPIQAGAIIQTNRASFFIQYIFGFGGNEQ